MDIIEKFVNDIGQNFATWRKLLNLTARQVSERAGISTVTYLKIENGNAGVSFGNIMKVAKALGVLQKIVDATDPYETDLGRARADIALPKRLRC